MGVAGSKTPPDVDLLPPRFERKPVPLDRVAIDPQQYLFGREKLDRLTSGFFAKPNAAMVHAALRPDFDEKVRIALYAEGGIDGKVDSSASAAPFGLSLGYTETDSNPQWQGQVRLGSDGSMRALASAFDTVSGVGAYALLPGEYLLNRKYERAARAALQRAGVGGEGAAGQTTTTSGSSSPSSVTSALWALPGGVQVGNGIAGPPVRYTHASTHDHGPGAEGQAAAAGAGGASDALGMAVSPRAVTLPNADSGSGARPGAPSVVVPEVGVRWVNPQQTVSVGAHLGLAQPLPFKVWGVTRGSNPANGTVLTAGVSVSSDDDRIRRAVEHAVAASKGGAGTGGANLQLPWPPGQSPFIVDASVSVAQDPLYEASLSYDGHRREAVAGYVHSMTVRRNVYNILEAKNVRGIYQYVDLGVEFRRQLVPPFTSTIAAAASWQLNRHVMLRARLGTRDISATAALKTWTDPALALSLTTSYDRVKGSGGLGVFLSLEKGGTVEYTKAVRGQQAVTPNRALEARPALSQRITDEVDSQPFTEPPGATTRAGLVGTGSSPANRFL